MLRFFTGIILVQIASVALVLVARSEARAWDIWLPTAVALGAIGLVAAFWFASVATNELHRLRADFAREREDLRVKAEREKTRLVRKSQKNVASETRRAESRANRKVALAVAAASAVGVLIVFTSSMALGLLLLSGAGSALGGYLVGRNWRPKARGGGGDIQTSDAPRRRLREESSAQPYD